MYINKIISPIIGTYSLKTNIKKPSSQYEASMQEGLVSTAYSYIIPTVSFKSKNELKTYLKEINRLEVEDLESGTSISFEPPVETRRGKFYYDDLRSFNDPNPQNLFSCVVNDMRYSETSDFDFILLRLIRDSRFDVSAKYSSGYSIHCNPLFILTTLNKPYLLQEALKKENANPNIRCGSDNHLSPLMRAVQTNNLDCAYVLLKSGKINEAELKRCLNGCSSQNKEMMGLLKSYPYVDNYINRMNSVDPSFINLNLNSIYDVLTNPQADVNFVDSNGNNIFHIINCVEDEEEAIRLLFIAKKREVNINRKNKQNQAPIELYFKEKKYNLVCAAIDNGADLSVFNDKYKNTFVHTVSSFVEEDTAIKMLDFAYERGFNLDGQNFVGITPVINATKSKKYKLLSFLINKGVSLNIIDNNGMTPMHYACMLNDEKLIDILLNNFVNLKIKDKFGKIASDYLKKPDLIAKCKFYQNML